MTLMMQSNVLVFSNFSRCTACQLGGWPVENGLQLDLIGLCEADEHGKMAGATICVAPAELISKLRPNLLLVILKGQIGSIGANAPIKPLGMAMQPGVYGVVVPFWPPW